MDTAWMARARCVGAPLRLFVPDREAKQPPATVAAYCGPCPVRSQCLDWALAWPGTVGYYGNTSSHQRRQLKRPRARLHCPSCGGQALAPLAGGGQVCVPCGVSWRAA